MRKEVVIRRLVAWWLFGGLCRRENEKMKKSLKGQDGVLGNSSVDCVS